ncbi:hypothetical protein AB395_00006821 (plasmid) [Sinorhizobium fredii CCBAU 45436]|nr:hypothetical protein AB395_00006821 [Sinorhizobium fredii CCBAU 45436]
MAAFGLPRCHLPGFRGFALLKRFVSENPILRDPKPAQ